MAMDAILKTTNGWSIDRKMQLKTNTNLSNLASFLYT